MLILMPPSTEHILYTHSFSSYLAPSVVTVVHATSRKTAWLGSPETAGRAGKMKDSHWLSAQGPHGIEVDPQYNKRYQDRRKLFFRNTQLSLVFNLVILYYITSLMSQNARLKWHWQQFAVKCDAWHPKTWLERRTRHFYVTQIRQDDFTKTR